MIPSPRLFRSRWAALLWAGGIVWATVDIANSAPPPATGANAAAASPDDAMGDPANATDLAAIATIVGG